MGPVKTICLLLTLSVAHAHESPEHTIDAINQHSHLTPEQLHQRAIAKRAIKQHAGAIQDLKAASHAAPKQLGIRLELARTQAEAGYHRDAHHTLAHALPLAKTPEQQAQIHHLRAECHQALKQNQQALSSIRRAFQCVPAGAIDWFLLRSRCQAELGQHQQRIQDLAAGLEQHPSAVLKSHWIDALVDAGQFDKALSEINHELADRRWKSSYLIKRARTFHGLQRRQEATSDLRAALAEIEPRMNPQRPDLLLLSEQATAYALLGNNELAEKFIKQLRAHHAPQWIIDRAAHDRSGK